MIPDDWGTDPRHGRPISVGVTVSARLVVLVSGAGTNLQALMDACCDPAYGARVVAVGADRGEIEGTARAERAGIPAFTVPIADHDSRAAWDGALTEAVASYEPDLVISAGFMRLFGARFLAEFDGRVINTHPSLLPAFPGTQGPAEALNYGVKVTGCTVHFVDSGVDTGPVIAQQPVPVLDGDDAETLHDRIKAVERPLLVATVGRLVREGWKVDERKVRIGS
jgi:phosphoribosylglycinamide formyltransferase 1